MSLRRPDDAPVVDWAVYRDWLAAQDHPALHRHFGQAIAANIRRFAQGVDILMLVSPSLGGHSTLAAARLLRDAGFQPRLATDARFLDPTSDGPALAEIRRTRLAAFRADLATWDARIETTEAATSAPLLVDASFTPFVPFDTPWRREHDWAWAWRTLVEHAQISLAIENVPFADASGSGLYAIDRHPRYTATIALGALSAQNVMLPAAEYGGNILYVPADPPIDSPWRVSGRPFIRAPASQAHKYSRGMVVVVGGEMPGAARLAARAAAHAGAGYVVLAGRSPDAGLDAIVQRQLSTPDDLAALLRDERIGAVVIGPGLGRSGTARQWVDIALASDRRLVLDADALTLLDADYETALRRTPQTWITPHYGEWSALIGDSILEYGKLARTAWLAEEGWGVIFKGADTVIGTPHGAAVLDRLAPSWLSTAGTGDVLSGVLAARMAIRQGDWCCGREAAWLHMRAAELAGAAFTADALIGHLPRAIEECL